MKKKLSGRTSKKSGLPPGTLVHVGERRAKDVEISIIDYNETSHSERIKVSVDDAAGFLTSRTVSWIDVVGLHDVNVLRDIGEKFGIHPLVMEDILNTEQRPKVQDLGDYLFVVFKMARPGREEYELEQVSLILKNQCVITFQEETGDVFEPIRERIRDAKGRIRNAAADYLVYSLIDAVVDGYFPYMESLSDSLEETEERTLQSHDIISLQEIHARRRELLRIRRAVYPLRDIVAFLERGDTMHITRSTNLYLKDVYDHTIQMIDTIESLRDVVASLLELYLSTSSLRTNDVMKVLTIIATIFIPLTFVAGIYGMNFQHMPELATKAGYPIVLIVMGGIALGMLFYFKRKKWL